ncbi:MAG: hypothetical protein M0Z77_08040 [Thermoplasmatales archaeon]|nr:hypothetical protein [Thermoplasmatales archaeon]
MNTDTKPLKQIIMQMEDSPVKQLILSLPDEISKEDLLSKFDLILQFLGSGKKEASIK